MHKKIAQKINKADFLIVTAGAGMGVDSNLPSFRGKEGTLQTIKNKGKQSPFHSLIL